jgi:hypothetical protein
MNIYGDVVTDEMTTAGARVAQLAFHTIGAHGKLSCCFDGSPGSPHIELSAFLQLQECSLFSIAYII